MPRSQRFLYVLAACAFLLLVWVLVLGVNLRRGLNHDEHQFVASGALIARNGLMPYRDFPYFHVPTLSFVYALLFHFTDYLLLAARLFSVFCSGLTLALLLIVAMSWLRNLRMGLRLLTGVFTVLLLVSTPTFLHSSGRAWNHDFPIFLTMLAAIVHGRWLARKGGTLLWMLPIGLLLGLATGVRVSFVFAAIPFAFSLFFVLPWRSGRTWGALVLLVTGGLVGLIPAIYTFALAPEQFIFGNLTYAQLNTAYYRQIATDQAALSLVQKLRTTAELVVTQPGNLLLVLLAAFAVWRVRSCLRVRTAPELLFFLLMLPMLLIGAFAPTPIQAQYLYPLFPLLALIFLTALAYESKPRLAVGLAGIAAAIVVVLALPRYSDGAAVVFDPAEWYPLKVHARGESLAHLANGEPVLTFAPIFALEGKAPIYPEFVTGPLAWRVAPLLSAPERAAAGLTGPDELETDLASKPPRAVFTGIHDNDAEAEEPLLDYARGHGYVPIVMPDQGVLWNAPMAAWDNRISLGAADLPTVPVAPGSTVLPTFYLMASQPLDKNLNVLVRVVAPDGKTELVRSEGWPWGRPTSTWPVGEVWPDGHQLRLPADAVPGPYRVELSFYNPATLDVVGDQPVVVGYLVIGEPAGGRPVDSLAQFGSCIELEAAEFPTDDWAPGATLPVHLTWQRTARDCGRYTVFVHLAGPDGLVAQQDQEPLQGFYPTSAWLLDVPIADDYELSLPAGLVSGEYQLLAGLYEPVTGQRLPLMRDEQVAGDAYVIGTVTVR